MKVMNSLVSIESCKKVAELAESEVKERQARVAADAVRAKRETFLVFIEYYIRILL
jgi:hypothetical protein